MDCLRFDAVMVGTLVLEQQDGLCAGFPWTRSQRTVEAKSFNSIVVLFVPRFAKAVATVGIFHGLGSSFTNRSRFRTTTSIE
jgi:hypothetical protein